MSILSSDRHVLVHWPEENAVSLILLADIKSPAPSQLHPGVVCSVKCRSHVYEGSVAAIGMCIILTHNVQHYIVLATCIVMYTFIQGVNQRC